jgi:hypothetical protein
LQRLRLTLADWQARRSVEVRIGGLEAALPMFGVESGDSAAR